MASRRNPGCSFGLQMIIRHSRIFDYRWLELALGLLFHGRTALSKEQTPVGGGAWAAAAVTPLRLAFPKLQPS